MKILAAVDGSETAYNALRSACMLAGKLSANVTAFYVNKGEEYTPDETGAAAVLSLSGVVASRSLRVAGDEMDQDIVQYLRNKYNLLIGEGIAEQIKWKIGSAYPLQPEKTMEVRGRNFVTGLPESIEVSSVEIREALAPSVQVIVDTIRDALDEIPPEIVADLMDVGICLAGGGGLLQGLADRLTDELKLRVWVAEDPLTCVARGAGMVFEDFDNLSRYLVGLERGSTPLQSAPPSEGSSAAVTLDFSSP